jgi:hypothetical protein
MEAQGYKVLDKFNSSDPHEGDQKVLAQMLGYGADLTRERHVVHYLYFPNNVARATAQDKLDQEGYETRHGIDSRSVLLKSLIAERTGIVNDEVVNKERELLTNITEADAEIMTAGKQPSTSHVPLSRMTLSKESSTF